MYESYGVDWGWGWMREGQRRERVRESTLDIHKQVIHIYYRQSSSQPKHTEIEFAEIAQTIAAAAANYFW